MPIRSNWTTKDDQLAAEGITARVIAQSLGGCTIVELADARGEIATVVRDLAQRSGVTWPIAQNEPLVGLLRILGYVAVRWPEAATPLGLQLLELLDLPTSGTEQG